MHVPTEEALPLWNKTLAWHCLPRPALTASRLPLWTPHLMVTLLRGVLRGVQTVQQRLNLPQRVQGWRALGCLTSALCWVQQGPTRAGRMECCQGQRGRSSPLTGQQKAVTALTGRLSGWLHNPRLRSQQLIMMIARGGAGVIPRGTGVRTGCAHHRLASHTVHKCRLGDTFDMAQWWILRV